MHTAQTLAERDSLKEGFSDVYTPWATKMLHDESLQGIK